MRDGNGAPKVTDLDEFRTANAGVVNKVIIAVGKVLEAKPEKKD